MKLFGKKAKIVQEALKKQGFYTGKIDGLFGRKSKRALRNFQKSMGLVVDGIYGHRTEQALLGKIHHTTANVHDVKSKYPRETPRNLINFFGKPGTNLVRIELPYPMKLAWDLDTVVTSILVNEKSKESFIGALNDILDYYGYDKIVELGLDLFGGTYNKRRIRGGRRWSTHAFGIAIDLNPDKNRWKQRAPSAVFSHKEYRPFIEIMERNGFYSLGHSRNFDYMHFQTAWRA